MWKSAGDRERLLCFPVQCSHFPQGAFPEDSLLKAYFFLHPLASPSYGSISGRALTPVFKKSLNNKPLHWPWPTSEPNNKKCSSERTNKVQKWISCEESQMQKTLTDSSSSLKDTSPYWIIKFTLDSLLSFPKREILNCRSLARQILLLLCLLLVVPLTWALCLFLVVPNYFLWTW